MNISERISDALKANETLTEGERWTLQDTMKALQFDQKFGMGAEFISGAAARLASILSFLQLSDRISEDEEEELLMIVNEIEAGREEDGQDAD